MLYSSPHRVELQPTMNEYYRSSQSGNLEKKNEPESTSDSGLPGASLRDKDTAHE
jgi:hypothetical protein